MAAPFDNTNIWVDKKGRLNSIHGRLQFKGNSSADLNSDNQTPTLVAGTNVTTVTHANPGNFCRVGNVVTVSGQGVVTQTATGASDFTLTLPVARSAVFAATHDAAGIAVFHALGGGAVLLSGGRLEAVAAAQTVKILFTTGTAAATSTPFAYTYQYRLA